MKALCNVTLLDNRQIGSCLWLARMGIEGEHVRLLKHVKAGMFLMLRCEEGGSLRFRRPFSFAEVDADKGAFTLYYRVLGDQTRKLSQTGVGTALSAILPLGNSFSEPGDSEEPILVGGGIGIVPLLMLTRGLEKRGLPKPRFYFGARNNAELTHDYINNFPADFRLATDDGSYGYQGTVVDLLIQDGINPSAHIYACGPPAMLKALSTVLPNEADAEASLESVMACGIGACYGCAVQTDGEGAEEIKLVCRDGPVFPLRSVRFD